MTKEIPIYFDSVIVSSPLELISETNQQLSRLKVRVFTKYANRNGSYITDAVADQLINSAITGSVPVIGFFDKESSTWASHSGPQVANGYGYVENFLGWEPFEDTDGITREYAVFSVVLFTDYFKEAQQIIGQNQSMEIDPASITGEWTMIQDQEYFVYSTAKMLGFCIIGSHEPCFSVSAFFSKNDEKYTTQYEKFAILCEDLKKQLQETEKFLEGGEEHMDDITENVADTLKEDIPAAEPASEPQEENYALAADNVEAVNDNEVIEAKVAEDSENDVTEENNTIVETPDFEMLYKEAKAQFDNASNTILNLQATINDLNNKITQLQNDYIEINKQVEEYQLEAQKIEKEKKNVLVDKYSKVLNSEDVQTIVSDIDNLSYQELESKFAIQFANNNFNNTNEKVPLCNPEQSQFARLMEKYRK